MKKLLLVAALILAVTSLVVARPLAVGLNDDVHFDYPGMKANDFHIQGTVHSAGGSTPLVTNIMVFGDGGPWYVTGYSLTRIGLSDDWTFQCDFKTTGEIRFCQWIHFGIMFEVEDSNIIVDLVGWWTWNGGPPVPDMPTPKGMTIQEGEYLQVPITGFSVEGGILTVVNDTEMPIDLRQLELAVTEERVPLEDMFSTGLGRPGEPSPEYPTLVWIDAIMAPVVLGPEEEIIIDLGSLGIFLQPGQFLQMRGEQIMVGSKMQQVMEGIRKTQTQNDWGWFWEQHGE